MELLSSDKKESNEIELIININAEEFDEARNKAYLKNRSRINVPGFRKGKAPRKTIEKMYGTAIFMNDAIESLYPDILDFAMNKSGFELVGVPRITDIDLKDNDTSVDIVISAALRPDVKIGKYKGLTAEKPVIEASEAEIDRELQNMRERNARLESVERPAQMGDISTINFEGFLDGVPFEGGKGENYELELGSGRFVPGFEESLIGMAIDEERDIDVTFPDNYAEHLAGKAVVFKVKLLDLKEKQLPDLDDDFAVDVSEFDTLDEYKASIKEKIETDRKAEVDEIFESNLFDQIIETMEADIPEAMIEEQTHKSIDMFNRRLSSMGMQPAQYMQMTGMTQSDLHDKMKENAEKQVRINLILEEIAKLENITISDDEIEEEYKRAAEEYKTEVDKLKDSVESDVIRRDLLLRAAAKVVTDSATAVAPKPDKDKDKDKDKKSASDKGKDSGKSKDNGKAKAGKAKPGKKAGDDNGGDAG